MLSGRSRVTARRLRDRGLLFLLFVLISGAFSATRSLAQDEAAIRGTLSDATGSAIAGGSVKIKNLETGSLRTLTTDDSGRFEAPALAVGAYEVSAEKAGFQPARTKVNLVLGQRATVDLQLAVAELQQNVQVQETAISTDVTTTETSGLVGERQVKELPLNGRSYDQLVTLNPGVVNYTSQRAGGIGTSNSVVGNMFSASGRRPQENLYLLNGVEYTGASEINNTPGGASGQLLGVDAVREFSVVKDDYGAEYGKRPGAQINIVTASGSNGVHGSAYEFLRNSTLDARNFFDHGDIPQFQRDVFGASLGGPIKKDNSFLFVNYEGFRQNLGLSDVTLVPDASSRATAVAGIRPLLALWPVANGPELLTYTGAPSGIAEAFTNPVQHVREDFGTARFDEALSSKDSLAAVYTVDDSTAHSPSNNPFTVDDIFLREQVVSLSETHIFSPRVLNRATFGFSRGGFYFNSGTTVDLPSWVNASQPVGAVVVGGGTTLNGASQIANGGTNAGSNLRTARNLFTAEDHLTLTHGNHLFDLGVWFQRLQSNDSLLQDQYGQISFSSLQTFIQQGIVSTYTYAPSYTPLGWRSSEGAFYAEDAVKLKPSLELRIGFRGEFTNGWNEADGRASNYLYNSAGVILPQPALGSSALAVNNAKFLPAPRLSLAWAPFASKKTVIRAGVGVYYALLDNLSYRLDQNPPYNTVYAVKNIPFSSIAPGKTYAGAKVIPSGVQPNLQTPTVESYTFKIEQQIAPNTVLSVGYIGSHGYHELLSLDTNLPVPTICPASPCPTGYPAGAYYFPANARLANNSVWNTTDWFSEGVSSYNGLEVDINHRIARGLQFRGAYTFAKALDDGDNMNTSVATNSPAFVANPLQPTADYGRASFDVRHSAVINATYDLPFGRSVLRRRAWLNRLIEDWQLSGIETIQSGLPFTPQLSYNPSNDGDTRNPVRPSWNPAFAGPLILGLPGKYFNPNSFVQPLPGTYGNVGRNVLQGPGLAELDLSIAKRFALSERFNLQFRAESFNLLNRANLNDPNPVVFTAATGGPSPTAGVITNTSTTSRQLQFGLKLLW
jgi:Carboxypeptidase regulatory-like domain